MLAWMIIILLLGVIVLSLYFLFKFQKKIKLYESRYSHQIKIDSWLDGKKIEIAKINSEIEELRSQYQIKKEIFEKLNKQIAIYDEEIEMAELGFYKPHFDFDTSERYKIEINTIRDSQKQKLKSGLAVSCHKEWTVGNSRAEGKKMTNRGIKLTSRAFNNECDSIMANVRWNNIRQMEQRIIKSFDTINKLNEPNAIIISRDYLNLKLKELWLTHEYAEKKQQEKEEQRLIREQMREEAKLIEEYNKSIQEEEKLRSLVKKAQKKAEQLTGDQLKALQLQIDELQARLAASHEKSERAKSMAEQTRRGYVYVISNIGSFGKDVFKIGMTRRLEPLDRVKELGDASVPFVFDTHAMISSEDAPTLESCLHKAFNDKRINMVNYRKEYFKVTLEEIESVAKKVCPEAEFIKLAEAKEYKQTMAILAQHEKGLLEKKEFPDSI